MSDLLLSQASHGTTPTESWHCEDCRMPTTLNRQGRCETCDSDAVTCRTYAPERDARASMGRAMYAMAAETIAKMEAKQ